MNRVVRRIVFLPWHLADIVAEVDPVGARRLSWIFVLVILPIEAATVLSVVFLPHDASVRKVLLFLLAAAMAGGVIGYHFVARNKKRWRGEEVQECGELAPLVWVGWGGFAWLALLAILTSAHSN